MSERAAAAAAADNSAQCHFSRILLLLHTSQSSPQSKKKLALSTLLFPLLVKTFCIILPIIIIVAAVVIIIIIIDCQATHTHTLLFAQVEDLSFSLLYIVLKMLAESALSIFQIFWLKADALLSVFLFSHFLTFNHQPDTVTTIATTFSDQPISFIQSLRYSISEL